MKCIIHETGTRSLSNKLLLDFVHFQILSLIYSSLIIELIHFFKYILRYTIGLNIH